MPQWQLNHFTNLSHGFLATSDVVVTNIVKFFFILSLHWLAFAVDDGVWCTNHKLAWVNSNNLELHGTETASHQEQITCTAWSISLQEIWLQVSLKEISSDALNGVIQRQYMDTLAIWHVSTGMDGHNISKTNSQVLTHYLVQSHLLVIEVVICKHNAHRVLALFAFDQYVVSTEEVQLLHFCLGERDYRIVIVESLLNDEAVWRPLLRQLLRLRWCYWSGFWSVVCHLVRTDGKKSVNWRIKIVA
mmetsp:Transcript_114916/g.187257  ORF Transcript_114916/g.187257 Transcript_114916/m.187257 type:complete len:246 (+) Transcript_114916:695-1432(+)